MVSKETKERIEQIMEEMQYDPKYGSSDARPERVEDYRGDFQLSVGYRA